MMRQFQYAMFALTLCSSIGSAHATEIATGCRMDSLIGRVSVGSSQLGGACAINTAQSRMEIATQTWQINATLVAEQESQTPTDIELSDFGDFSLFGRCSKRFTYGVTFQLYFKDNLGSNVEVVYNAAGGLFPVHSAEGPYATVNMFGINTPDEPFVLPFYANMYVVGTSPTTAALGDRWSMSLVLENDGTINRKCVVSGAVLKFEF